MFSSMVQQIAEQSNVGAAKADQARDKEKILASKQKQLAVIERMKAKTESEMSELMTEDSYISHMAVRHS